MPEKSAQSAWISSHPEAHSGLKEAAKKRTLTPLVRPCRVEHVDPLDGFEANETDKRRRPSTRTNCESSPRGTALVYASEASVVFLHSCPRQVSTWTGIRRSVVDDIGSDRSEDGRETGDRFCPGYKSG